MSTRGPVTSGPPCIESQLLNYGNNNPIPTPCVTTAAQMNSARNVGGTTTALTQKRIRSFSIGITARTKSFAVYQSCYYTKEGEFENLLVCKTQ